MRLNLFVRTAVMIFVSSAAAFSVMAADTKLPTDPAITFGQLANGLHYALEANSLPPGQVSIRLQVQAGSLQETDAQRGAAHLLQHLAFVSTTTPISGQGRLNLNALNLPVSPHHNASVDCDRTIFQLDLSDAKTETINTALANMAAWVGNIDLTTAAVDQVKTRIIAEFPNFDVPDEHIRTALNRASFAGTIVGERAAFGDAKTIMAMTPASLKGFYDTWYRPETMTLVVVGAIEPHALETFVREKFSALTNRAPARMRPVLATLAVTNQIVVATCREDHAAGSEVEVRRVIAQATPIDSAGFERDQLCRRLAEQVFSRRIRTLLARDTTLPFCNATMFSYHWLEFDVIGVQATARKTGLAIPSLTLAIMECRKLLEFGPTDNELAVERKAMADLLDAAVAGADSRDNDSLADDICATISTGRISQSPAQRRDLLRPMLASITRAEILAALEKFRSRPGRDVVAVTGRDDLGTNAEQIIRDTYTKAFAAPVAAPKNETVDTWAYGDLPTPTGIPWMGERADEAAQGLKVLWHHRDGIRIQVRHSDARPVVISLRFEINNSSENPQARRAGVEELIQRGLIPGGLGRHSAKEVQKLFADSSVNFQGVRITDDAIIYSATCNGKDLTRALQLLRAYMGDPGWRSDAEPLVKQAWLDSLAAQEHNVAAQVQRQITTKLAGPYAWQRPATADEIKALTFADAAAWLGENLDQSRLTLTVTGDAPEDALEIVALWFGQYRVNSPFVMVDPEGFRNMALPPVPLNPGVERVPVDSPKAEAVVHVLWPTDDMFNIVRTRRLEIVAACLNERLQKMLPERFGTNCTVNAWSSASDTVRGAGQIHVMASVTPEQAEQALALIRSEAAALGEKGIDDDLFNRVKKQLEKSLAEKKQGNDWWQAMLPYASWQPFRIFWISTSEKDYESTTAVEASALAKQFLVDANVCAVVGISSIRDNFHATK